jgi:hypothetical protein
MSRRATMVRDATLRAAMGSWKAGQLSHDPGAFEHRQFGLRNSPQPGRNSLFVVRAWVLSWVVVGDSAGIVDDFVAFSDAVFAGRL